jgi:hypothetical protein
MAEVINTNVFDAEKKFVDFAGLDYFWEKAKAYVDGADKVTADKVAVLEGVVGDSSKGLVKDVNYILDELETISGGVGSVGTQIDNAIAALKLPETYEAKGAAADVAGDLADHAADAVAHVTADERASWNAAKTAIDTFLKDADMTEKAVDTLAELQTYMTTDGAAAAELVGRVAALEGIDHDAYKGADTALETSLKGYVDGKVDGKFDAAGAAATAKSEAIAQAKADAAETLKSYYTKDEVDGLVDALNGNIDSAQAAAETYAKTYTDALFTSFQFAGNSDIDKLFA